MNRNSRGLYELSEVLVRGLDGFGQRQLLTAMCADLLEAEAAALLTLDMDGEPAMEAASEETAQLLTRLELAYKEGPGMDAFQTGARVECADVTVAYPRWPRFAHVAHEAGVAAAAALPCRSNDRIIGAITLYMTEPGHLTESADELADGVSNIVALGVSAHHSHALAVLNAQLQGALTSRVSIEQAKGVLSEGRAYPSTRRSPSSAGTPEAPAPRSARSLRTW